MPASWSWPAIICGLYAFVWGWMNAARFNLRNIMLIWTIAIVVSIIASFMGAPIYSPSQGAAGNTPGGEAPAHLRAGSFSSGG